MTRTSNASTMLENPHRARGLLAAALAAWAFFMVVVTAVPLLAMGVRSLVTGQDVTSFSSWPSAGQIFGSFGFAAAIGLPVSLIICFVVGYPAWKFASAHGLTTRWDAVRIGAVIGAALCLLVTVGGHIAIYIGSGRYSFAQAGVLLTKDSLPTFQGVLFDLVLTLFYAAVGAVAGLAAWLAGGSKSVVSVDAQRCNLREAPYGE